MHRRSRSARLSTTVAVIAALGLALTACSGSSDETSTATPTATSSLVPAEYQGKDINVALITGSLPLADVTEDQKSFQGVDYDLLQAIAEKLGVRFKYTGTGFDNMIPGVSNGRYDLAAAGFYDTAEREATVDMVTYMSDGAIFVTSKGKQDAAQLSEDDLCGMSVGVATGGAQAARLPDASKACQEAGKKPIGLDVFPTTGAAVLALTSGRIDAFDISTSIGLYLASKRPDLEVGKPFAVVPVGFVLAKSSPLSAAIADATNEIIDDGTYAKILDKWGLGAAGVEKSEVNPLAP